MSFFKNKLYKWHSISVETLVHDLSRLDGDAKIVEYGIKEGINMPNHYVPSKTTPDKAFDLLMDYVERMGEGGANGFDIERKYYKKAGGTIAEYYVKPKKILFLTEDHLLLGRSVTNANLQLRFPSEVRE